MEKSIPGKFGYRIDYDLRRRLSVVPKEAYDEIYHTLTDQDGKYRIARTRWKIIMENNTRFLYDFEALVFCKVLGCTLKQLMDADQDLLEIYLRKKASDEARRIEHNYGLTA